MLVYLYMVCLRDAAACLANAFLKQLATGSTHGVKHNHSPFVQERMNASDNVDELAAVPADEDSIGAGHR